jgi:hypothetical protein
MSEVTVRLRGRAAQRAQHLVREFDERGIDVLPLSPPPDSDRGAVHDVLIGISASAAYDAVKAVVNAWLETNGIASEDVDVAERARGKDRTDPNRSSVQDSRNQDKGKHR